MLSETQLELSLNLDGSPGLIGNWSRRYHFGTYVSPWERCAQTYTQQNAQKYQLVHESTNFVPICRSSGNRPTKGSVHVAVAVSEYGG